jgi:FkbM family methyltransferase
MKSDKRAVYQQAALSRRTRLLRWLWFGFRRLRRLVAVVMLRPWGHWDGEAWRMVGPRLFGRRTALALDSDGHRVRVRLGQWVDLTSLLGRVEERAVERIVKGLPRGGTFVDAGAHIGRYSMMAAEKIGPSGRVIAIEPSPDNYAFLCENRALNGMNWITPVQVALSKQDGVGEMVRGSDQATNSLRADWLNNLEGASDQRPRQAVVVRSLASLLTEVGVDRVDLLKIDVEGAELDVLTGAADVLQSGRVREIVCEVHEPSASVAQVEAVLKNRGYAVEDLGGGELHAVWRAPRAEAEAADHFFRLAIVGCGAITEMAHIPAAVRLTPVRLVGLVDSDLARAQALAARHGIPRAVARLEDLSSEVDAVILATPPHVRGVLAQTALACGLHVLCEKPMANSAAECRAMMEQARVAQRTLVVAHTYRFFHNRAYARTLFRAGHWGRLVSARIEQGDPFSWPTRTAYTLRKQWVPGGVLFNEGVHILDMLFWWFGTPAGFDYYDDSLGGLESNVRLTLHYPEGTSIHYRLSRTCSLKNRIEMQFEKASLAFQMYNMAEAELAAGGQTCRLTLAPEPWDFVAAATAQLRDFLLAAMEGRPTEIPAEAGLAVVDLIEACYRSKRQRPRPLQAPAPGMTW